MITKTLLNADQVNNAFLAQFKAEVDKKDFVEIKIGFLTKEFQDKATRYAEQNGLVVTKTTENNLFYVTTRPEGAL